jgi:hypothetical protein
MVLGQIDDLGSDALRNALAADYRATEALGLGAFPDLGAPLDPTEGGPLGVLWPDGPPPW